MTINRSRKSMFASGGSVRSLSFPRMAGRAVAIVTISGTALMFGATPALADTSAATAQAASLAPLNLPVLNTGTESASNDGSMATDIATANPALSILGGQSTVTAGAFQQTAVATASGTSSACAGLLGNGAVIQVGQTKICNLTTKNGETGGITIGGPAGVGVITATAIVETCRASSTGTLIATATLADATALGGLVKIPLHPGANTSLLGLINLNTQSASMGKITATALSIPLLGLKIGTVTCGPNSVAPVTSAFPIKSLPIAGVTALLLAAIGVPLYRRRRNALVD